MTKQEIEYWLAVQESKRQGVLEAFFATADMFDGKHLRVALETCRQSIKEIEQATARLQAQLGGAQ